MNFFQSSHLFYFSLLGKLAISHHLLCNLSMKLFIKHSCIYHFHISFLISSSYMPSFPFPKSRNKFSSSQSKFSSTFFYSSNCNFPSNSFQSFLFVDLKLHYYNFHFADVLFEYRVKDNSGSRHFLSAVVFVCKAEIMDFSF